MTGMLMYDLNAQQIQEWHRWAAQESLAKLVARERPRRPALSGLVQRFVPVMPRRQVASRAS